MTEAKTLFVQFDSSVWTEREIENALDALDAVLPEGAEGVAVDDSIEFMDEDQVDRYIKELIEATGYDDGGE